MFRNQAFAIAAPLVLAVLLVSCSNKPGGRVAGTVSLCELRDRPRHFSDNRVRTSGWIYTDIENFDLTDDKCGVALGYEERKDGDVASDAEQQRFEGLLKDARKGTFNTNAEVFAVVEGRFTSTSSGTNPAGSPQSPNKILLTRIVCSVAVPMAQTGMPKAVSSCFQHRVGRPTP